jgi:methionyl aminopeptidase
MIYYKTKAEIELARESCLLVSKTLAETARLLKPGITTLSLDKFIGRFIRDHGAIPSFLRSQSLCLLQHERVLVSWFAVIGGAHL